MKRLVYCLDGTSNTYDTAYPTNVVITHKSIAESDAAGVKQVARYDRGVGTDLGVYFLGMTVGLGLMRNVMQAYAHLCENYEAGDEIYIFGFSRGAFTARSFAGLIRHCGLLDVADDTGLEAAKDFYEQRLLGTPEQETALAKWRNKQCSRFCVSDQDDAWRAEHIDGYASGDAPIVRIRYLGVWDTVRSLGVNEQAYDWHDASLSAYVDYARHAVALDERRNKFKVELWDNMEALNAEAGGERYQQKWFPGGHGSVGGGGPERGLSDEALHWLLLGAEEAGLALKKDPESQVFTIRPDPLAPLENIRHPWWKLHKPVFNFAIGLFGRRDRAGPERIEDISHAARVRYYAPGHVLTEGKPYRPGALTHLEPLLDAQDPPYSETQYRALVENASNEEEESDEQTIVRSGGREYRVHVVRKGDMLSTIAQKYSGDASLWRELHAINRASIEDPDYIYVGQRVFVPLDWRPSKSG